MAKIDTSAIEGYENMSAEDKLNAVLAMDVPDDLSEEITKLKGQVSKANSEVSEWKKKHNNLLSDEERKATENQEAFQALQQEVEVLRKEKAVTEDIAGFMEVGLSGEEASKAATAYEDGNKKELFKILSAFRGSLEKSIRAELMKNNPKPGAVGGAETSMTLEKFRKLGPAERLKFSNEHPEEYKQLYN